MNNPWQELPQNPPYVLACDRAAIDQFNVRNKNPKLHIHTSAIPEPFLGSPDAPIVILSRNPGHSDDDASVHADPSFASRSRANLLHAHETFPLYLLDPEILPKIHVPGRKWWSDRLGPLIRRTDLSVVAKCVFVAEYFPYHSVRFGHSKLQLESQRYTFQLVRRAVARNAFVIVFRGLKDWFRSVPELNAYPRLARAVNVQRPYVSAGNLPKDFENVVALVQSAG